MLRTQMGRVGNNGFAPKNFARRVNQNYHAPQQQQQYKNRGGRPQRPAGKSLYVRNMPEGVRHGVNQFKQALAGLTIDQKQNWIAGTHRFKRLALVGNIPESHRTAISRVVVSEERTAFIDSYLEHMATEWNRVSEQANEALLQSTEYFARQWDQQHPHERCPENLKLLLDPGYLTGTHSKEFISCWNATKGAVLPKMFNPPGSNNFQDLKNAIKLFSSNRTICLSFDIEAYERDNDVITEIGIAVYDPRENQWGVTPTIRNWHLIIAEAVDLNNGNWVLDMKECFIHGESLVMPLQECVNFMQAIINYYMITPPPYLQSDPRDHWDRAFIGHSVEGDFKWLKKLKIQIPETRPLNHLGRSISPYIIDTHKIFHMSYGKENGSLGKVLRLFQLPHAFLHNAGNDAHYTLKLMMHLCDANSRLHNDLDNIASIQKRILDLKQRSNTEGKIVPMSYPLTVRGAGGPNMRGKKKDLVPQTEFGGCTWFDNAQDAFGSTVAVERDMHLDSETRS
ncbi:uncharacterized protein KNAG_0F00240 [Huiozyma naganishii CBS 8797]|uniref:Gfd2/YDR514C-like C-terminal domain-containing protein n=1 Tax=Huiozyma naganishii (strain ATCC MYA-139 / BCRC 22969 / CBS 8797 / KCTC 17520 / NBRC 10181 / NCYC 3082 / Yp74L-3) TaxID=1071383 RepID=J7S850_HUIN7|nr:hypothetical protein KNAG_0F00240 [Kazachstania naganishii CBS 8797]CCK70696.1 hypothetical protein KNAG_0F00240 [Kazachstania naganishii CBS 8797]